MLIPNMRFCMQKAVDANIHLARLLAMAKPMPRVPPVMTAVFTCVCSPAARTGLRRAGLRCRPALPPKGVPPEHCLIIIIDINWIFMLFYQYRDGHDLMCTAVMLEVQY